MNINLLFESLDSKVFTDEMKETLETSFNEAVELKSIELAEVKISEKTEELSELQEAFKLEAVELAEKREEEILAQVDAYLEKVVEEFMTEAKDTLDETLVNEKADLMIEAFDSMLIAGGVNIQSIVEAKDSTDVETKLAESVAKYDELIEANIELEKMAANLIKMGVIAEMQEGLSVVEAAKFVKLAEFVEFSKDAEYANKLETIKESVKGAKEVTEDVITEADTKTKSVYSHLV
jgi:hypothetical protein